MEADESIYDGFQYEMKRAVTNTIFLNTLDNIL